MKFSNTAIEITNLEFLFGIISQFVLQKTFGKDEFFSVFIKNEIR